VLCVGHFGEELGEGLFAVFETDSDGIVGVSVCCVLDSLVWVCGIVCVLCLGAFGVGLSE